LTRLRHLKLSLYAEHEGDDAEPHDRGSDRGKGGVVDHGR
jgi:hypothetical protein